MSEFDVIIIGAGAAGLMCAIEAAKRSRQVLVLEKTNKIGKKILMSGGGRCNFTNYYIDPEKYISHNPHFCKSALSRYTQWDFISLVEQYDIPYYEKTLGQLFCHNKASDITTMLEKEVRKYGGNIALTQQIKDIKRNGTGFWVITDQQTYTCDNLVIATGGLSIPTLGSSPFGYQVAESFGINVFPTRAGLVPFTLHVNDKSKLSELSGVSVDCEVSCQDVCFRENMLFTHRGLSGPAMLQISSYWQPGDALSINLMPDTDLLHVLTEKQSTQGNVSIRSVLSEYLPKRVLAVLFDDFYSRVSACKEPGYDDNALMKPLKQLNAKEINSIVQKVSQWQVKPNATEGYRTAEVTLGGVDCDEVSSKTFESHKEKGLYFIGEVLDITGWLGGYNFQWAWSSGWAAGQVV